MFVVDGIGGRLPALLSSSVLMSEMVLGDSRLRVCMPLSDDERDEEGKEEEAFSKMEMVEETDWACGSERRGSDWVRGCRLKLVPRSMAGVGRRSLLTRWGGGSIKELLAARCENGGLSVIEEPKASTGGNPGRSQTEEPKATGVGSGWGDAPLTGTPPATAPAAGCGAGGDFEGIGGRAGPPCPLPPPGSISGKVSD